MLLPLEEAVLPPKSPPGSPPALGLSVNGHVSAVVPSSFGDSPQQRAVKMDKDTKRPPADQKLDQQKVIALTEYVQKLGSVERAREALDALEQLRRAA